MATNVVPNAIVPEVLTKDNYATWSVYVENYLLAQDLWDIVEKNSIIPGPDEADYKTWRKKNAMALHAIHISCGPEIFSQIRKDNSAKTAWKTLADMHGGRLTVKLDVERCDSSSNQRCDSKQSFFEKVERGDWSAAFKINNYDPTVMSSTSGTGKTALHIAVIAGHVQIVENLMQLMPPKISESRDQDGYTALALAADLTENTKMAERMVTKNPNLVSIKDNEKKLPVVLASARGHKEMTQYLYHQTPLHILKNDDYNATLLFTHSITSEIFDVAWDLLQKYKELPIVFDFDELRPCYALARLPSAFPCKGRLCFLKQWIYPKISQTYEQKYLSHLQAIQILDQISEQISTFNESLLQKASVYQAMLEAVKYGNTQFIKKMTAVKPDLFWVVDEYSRGIFSYAILHRQEKIFNLIYGLKERREKITSQRDIFHNNMLHLAGMLPPSTELDRRSGAALQMQRELQWFKAVKRITHPKCNEDKNRDGQKPLQLFAKNHEDLLKEGEKWAKDTATSFTVVGTLIMTIMFAAAFIVPGGSDQQTGIPFFLHDRVFTVFIISDALSLSASSTSVLMFLGILISRYAAEDFLELLPRKLLIGLTSLFFSVLTMMIAFVAALSIMIRKDLQIVIVAILFASAPVIIFVILQFGLFVEIFISTYWSTILAKK